MIYKKIIPVLIMFIFFCLNIIPLEIYGEEAVSDVSGILEEYTDYYGDLITDGLEKTEDNPLAGLSVKDLMKKIINGEAVFSLSDLWDWLIKIIAGEVYDCVRLLALIVIISVLCSYITGLREGFGGNGVVSAAFYACYVAAAGIISSTFCEAAGCVTAAIENISVFMKMIVPVVITTLISSGAVISASTFEPVLIATVEISVGITESFLIPLIMLGTAMNIANNVSDRFKTKKMAGFINKCVKWGLCIMLTIFVSTAGIQSIAASGADGLTIKLTKFAASNLIPVVGGILSESVETVMNCSVLIKNTVGVVGMICLAGMAVVPLIKISAILIAFRLTAAITEPISEAGIVNCLSETADSVSLLFSVLAASAVMFVIVLTVVINAGNTVIMLGR